MRQLLYTMFISNNRALFHSWWKENLVKHQNVPIYYEKWLPAKFSLAFCVFIKRSICLNESCLGQNLLYLIFLKNVLISSWKSFNFKFQPQWKDLKSSYKVRQSLAPFCHLNSLILGQSSVKGLRFIKNDKEIKFEGVWREIESKQSF